MASSLSELREALAALGVSTATRDLRGAERRAELQRRLLAAQDSRRAITAHGTSHAASVESLTLSELRQALEARGLATLTPGLKGDARRHALGQRLLHADSNDPGSSRSDRSLETELVDEEDARSVVSVSSGSTIYSTAREFLFFDLSTDEPRDARQSMPALQLPSPSIHRSTLAERETTDARSGGEVELEAAQEALFERRQQLHALRKEQQRQVEASLDRAGISQRLELLSTRLEALAREQQRLERGFFGHELVTSLVLGALSQSIDSEPSTSEPRVLELVQHDALELIRRHQQSTRQLLDRTKQAVAIIKTARQSDSDADRASMTGSSRETELEREIRDLEAAIQRKSALSSRSSVSSSVSADQPASSTADQAPVLTRCRSVPHSMFLHEWKQLTLEQRQQLHAELRRAASFHIQRDRICLQCPRPNTARSVDRDDAPLGVQQQPTRADRLGVKARFLEASKRSPLEVHRAYQAALDADSEHVPNLVHYASFLAFRLCNKAYSDQVERLLQRAIAVAPRNAQALLCYAKFLLRVRLDAPKAADVFESALKHLEPRDPTRADVMGEFADALRSSEGAATTSTPSDGLNKARELLVGALEIVPSHLENHRRLLRVLCALGDVEQAEQHFRRLNGLLGRQNQPQDKRLGENDSAKLTKHFAQSLAITGHSTRPKISLARSPKPDQPVIL